MSQIYREKLLDPRWQKLRLRVLERDGWCCVACGESKKTLHVHHGFYEGEPWDAPEDTLWTLCEACHEYLGDHLRDAKFEIGRVHPNLVGEVVTMIFNFRQKTEVRR